MRGNYRFKFGRVRLLLRLSLVFSLTLTLPLSLSLSLTHAYTQSLVFTSFAHSFTLHFTFVLARFSSISLATAFYPRILFLLLLGVHSFHLSSLHSSHRTRTYIHLIFFILTPLRSLSYASSSFSHSRAPSCFPFNHSLSQFKCGPHCEKHKWRESSLEYEKYSLKKVRNRFSSSVFIKNLF